MQIKKNIYLIAILVGWFSTAVYSQNNPSALYDPNFNWAASGYLPSKLGENMGSVSVNLPFNFSVWTNNNYIPSDKFWSLANASKIDSNNINPIINKMGSKNYTGFGVNYSPIGVAIKIRKKSPNFNEDTLTPVFRDDEILTFAVEVNLRGEGSMYIPKEAAQLIWQGNRAFAGTTTNLKQYGLNAYAQSEIALAVAAPIRGIFNNPDMRLRLGTRFKFIQGQFNISMPQGDGSFTTQSAANGGTITTNFGYKINTSNRDFKDGINLSTNGFGWDFGATFYYKSNWVASFGLIDVGFVNYSRSVQNYNTSNTAYDGVTYSGTSNISTSSVDTLLYTFDNNANKKSYNAPLPTRLFLQLEYKIQAEDKKGNTYDQHQFYFNYIQGFRDYASAVIRPNFSLAYTYSLKNHLNVGTSFSFYGFSNLQMATHLSYRAGAFRIGGSFGNWLTVIPTGSNGALQFSVNMGLFFK